MNFWSFTARPIKTLRLAAVFVAGAGTVLSVAQAQEPAASPGSGYHLDATWKPGGEGGWDLLAVDPHAHRLYVIRPDRVQVIDTDRGTLLGEITGLEGGHGVAVVSELNRGFATSGKAGTVIVFDLQTLKAVGEPVKVGNKPDAVIYEPLTRHVFAFNGDSDDASVIDAATAKVVATIPLGGGPELPVSDGKGTLFVNLEDKSETLAIDVQTNKVVHRWSLAPGEGPTGLALDPAKRRLYAACHNEQMIVLDADNGKLLGKVPIDKGVDGCGFDPETGFAFAPCGGDGTLTVAKEDPVEDFHAVEQVKTRPSARTMALDPTTHAVYLAAADFEPAPTPAPGAPRTRPKMIAGTFAILKFVR